MSSPSRMMLPLPNCFSMVDTAEIDGLVALVVAGACAGRRRRGGHGRESWLSFVCVASFPVFSIILSAIVFSPCRYLLVGGARAGARRPQEVTVPQDVRRTFSAEPALEDVNLVDGGDAERRIRSNGASAARASTPSFDRRHRDVARKAVAPRADAEPRRYLLDDLRTSAARRCCSSATLANSTFASWGRRERAKPSQLEREGRNLGDATQPRAAPKRLEPVAATGPRNFIVTWRFSGLRDHFTLGSSRASAAGRRRETRPHGAREGHGDEAANWVVVVVIVLGLSLPGVEVAAREVERVVGGRDRTRSRLPEKSLVDVRVVPGAADGEADRADGLFGRAAARPRHAGDGHGHQGAADTLHALGHLARRRLADGAEVGDRLGLDAEDAGLDLVVVGDDAAAEEASTTPAREVTNSPARPPVHDSANASVAGGSCARSAFATAPGKRLAVDGVDAGPIRLRSSLSTFRASPCPSSDAGAAHDELDVVDGMGGPEVQRRGDRTFHPRQDPGQTMIDVRLAHAVDVPRAHGRARQPRLGQRRCRRGTTSSTEHASPSRAARRAESRLRAADAAPRTPARSRPRWAAPSRRSGTRTWRRLLGVISKPWVEKRFFIASSDGSSACVPVAEQLGHDVDRPVVLGRPEPSGGDDESTSARSRTSTSRIDCGIIRDDDLLRQLEPGLEQPLGDEGRRWCCHLPAQHLVANRQQRRTLRSSDPGTRHLSSTLAAPFYHVNETSSLASQADAARSDVRRIVDATMIDALGRRRYLGRSRMRIRYAAKTDVGMKRNHNEDYFSLIEDEQLFFVADGMGGHASGEVASKMAADVMTRVLRPHQGRRGDLAVQDGPPPLLRREPAGRRHQDGEPAHLPGRQQGGEVKGMGTTIVSGQVVGDKFYIAHVGDSRCYRIRAAAIQQMTRDHSLLEDYKDAKPNMSEDEQRKFPHKNVITRALGMREHVQVDVLAHDIQDRDTFLLCSDGLSGMVEDPKLLELVQERGQPRDGGLGHRSRRPTPPAAPTTSRCSRSSARIRAGEAGETKRRSDGDAPGPTPRRRASLTGAPR